MKVQAFLFQVVSTPVCAGLPVHPSLPGAGGLPCFSHAGHWLPLLQGKQHRVAEVCDNVTLRLKAFVVITPLT